MGQTDVALFNEAGIGNVYPAGGDSLGLWGSSPVADTTQPPSKTNQSAMGNPFSGNLIRGALTMLGLVILIMVIVHYTARRGGAAEDFSNIKSTFYNVLIIALVAATGIPAVEYGFIQLARVNVPFAKDVAAYIASR